MIARLPHPKAIMRMIALPKAMVIVSGQDLGMDEVVESLSEALKEARKAAEQYDVKTFQSMMKDKAKPG